MNEHVTDHLSAYLDDELDAGARASVEEHVRACRGCAADLEDLRRVIARAASITAYDAKPPRDLWAGINARISPRSGVVAFEPRKPELRNLEPATRSASRRVSLSFAQLAAAAALLMAVSGTTAWMLRGRAPVPAGSLEAAVIEAEIEPRASVNDVRPVNFADAQYDAAVSDLERALDERRNDLNPRTVEILERNLKLIDAAIAQARQALEDDPGNTYLNRHLVDARRRKLDLLRRATAITEGD